jgi:hypothetical protein
MNRKRTLQPIALGAMLMTLAACGEDRGSPAPRSAAPAPAAPTVGCVSDVGAHAAEEARRMYDPLPEELVPDVEPLRMMGETTATPFDLDGDGRPEISVSFPSQYGAYSRQRWIYSSAGGCARSLGNLEETFLWLGTTRTGGHLDLWVLEGLDEAYSGGGTLKRYAFDGTRYVVRDTLECPTVDVQPRDPRCPGRDGAPGTW